ncbi:hypothetical protein [Streptomyces antimicrobicus]|uniref:Bulb-type lectin domain-containing protein n=1 Tax=Streptomyces antimicrobicus TaxID=2883108 RepID=A0ABS8B2D4_9ACTN|nr:hypothetical protein [Streptomyces antimicrobicus]MCB5178763.1 hypothetical protein [Streptomyces antimicrobicus]
MRNHRLLRSAFTSLLAASALTGLVPAAASAAPAAPAEATACDMPYDTRVVHRGAGTRLAAGESLTSPTGTTALAMQPDGNLVLHALGRPGGAKLPLWHSGTWGNPGAYALMQEDGNFVVYKKDGGPDKGGALWHTGTFGATGTDRPALRLHADGNLEITGHYNLYGRWTSLTRQRSAMVCTPTGSVPYRDWLRGDFAETATVWLMLQSDNNLVMYRKSDGQAVWSSGTWGGDKPVTLQMDANGDLVVRQHYTYATLWHSNTEGSRGAYALLQDDGNLVVYNKDGGPGKGGALWHSGTGNKV